MADVIRGEAARSLRRVKRTILKYPQLLNMSIWVNGKIRGCGTVACIAGHVALDQGWHVNKNEETVRIKDLPKRIRGKVPDLGDWGGHKPNGKCDIYNAAKQFLGGNAHMMFTTSRWPTNLRERYDAAWGRNDHGWLKDVADDPKGCAQATADRIDHFIKTGK